MYFRPSNDQQAKEKTKRKKLSLCIAAAACSVSCLVDLFRRCFVFSESSRLELFDAAHFLHFFLLFLYWSNGRETWDAIQTGLRFLLFVFSPFNIKYSGFLNKRSEILLVPCVSIFCFLSLVCFSSLFLEKRHVHFCCCQTSLGMSAMRKAYPVFSSFSLPSINR